MPTFGIKIKHTKGINNDKNKTEITARRRCVAAYVVGAMKMLRSHTPSSDLLSALVSVQMHVSGSPLGYRDNIRK